MSVIPKAYSFVPDATTGAAHIAGLRAFLAVSSYWSEISYDGTTLTISNKTLPYRIVVVRAAASLSVRFSHDGTLFSSTVSTTNAYTFATTTGLGAGTNTAWIVETEDSLSWYARSAGSLTTTTSPFTDALGFCFHAGKIFTPDNRSDDANNVGVFGLLAGHAAPYTNANINFALNTETDGSQSSQMLRGATWEKIRIQSSFVRAWNPGSTGTYPEVPNRKYSAPMGDSDAVERLPPLRVMGISSGTTSNTRYWRARHWAVGETDASSPIESTSVRVSSADPNIAWRHSAYTSLVSAGSQNSPRNTIYLWAPTTTPLTI